MSKLREQLERQGPAIKIATSVGHGIVRKMVMGIDFKRRRNGGRDRRRRPRWSSWNEGVRCRAVELAPRTIPASTQLLMQLLALAAAIQLCSLSFYSSHVRDEEHESLDAAEQVVIDVGCCAALGCRDLPHELVSHPVWGCVLEGRTAGDRLLRWGETVSGD